MATPLLFTVPTAVTTAPDEYCTVKVTCPAVAGFPPLVTVADKFTLVLSVVAEAAAGVVEVAAPWGLTVSWAGPAVSVFAPTTGMLTERESVGALAWLTWHAADVLAVFHHRYDDRRRSPRRVRVADVGRSNKLR